MFYIHIPVGNSNTVVLYFSHQVTEGMLGWGWKIICFVINMLLLLWIALFWFVSNAFFIGCWTEIYSIHITVSGRHTIMNLTIYGILSTFNILLFFYSSLFFISQEVFYYTLATVFFPSQCLTRNKLLFFTSWFFYFQSFYLWTGLAKELLTRIWKCSNISNAKNVYFYFYCCAWYMLYFFNSVVIKWLWVRSDLEGSSHSLFQVVTQRCLEGLQETVNNPSQDSWLHGLYSNQIPLSTSKVLCNWCHLFRFQQLAPCNKMVS